MFEFFLMQRWVAKLRQNRPWATKNIVKTFLSLVMMIWSVGFLLQLLVRLTGHSLVTEILLTFFKMLSTIAQPQNPIVSRWQERSEAGHALLSPTEPSSNIMTSGLTLCITYYIYLTLGSCKWLCRLCDRLRHNLHRWRLQWLIGQCMLQSA